MPQARRHLDGCDLCQDLMRLHLDQEGRLAQLSRPPDTPRTPACPQESQWPELAAGLIGENQSAELLRHAASCDHCGPLLRQSLEDFNEDVTPAEEEFLAGLEFARPETQKRLAARLARTTPWWARVIDWLHGLFRRIPLRAWAYAGSAVSAAAFLFIMTLPPP